MTDFKKRRFMKTTKQPAAIHLGNCQGFTLIETLISLLVFSFGILAVMALTISAMNGFSQSRITTVEVNRTTLNLEALKEARYDEGKIFRGAVQTTPVGTDGATVGYNDADDVVVVETKLIRIQNNSVRGIGAGGNYELYYTKPLID
jgi:type II secretory pathway pseudopilin PulG